MEKYKFFWGGPFSNWYPCEFTVDGIDYNCGEQFMMYQKSITFGDNEIAKQVINTSDPKVQKKLGRQIKNFDSVKWDEVKYDLIKRGLKAKFSQDIDMKDELLKYKGYIFVEASPFDRIWGIGYDKDTALDNINNWGENLLGKIITELSNEIV